MGVVHPLIFYIFDQLKNNIMRKFNINDEVYVQITELGWKHLQKTLKDSYIENCIKLYRREINGEDWYLFTFWDLANHLPATHGGTLLYETNILFDDKNLKRL